MATIKIYIVTLEEVYNEPIDRETDMVKTITDINAMNIFATLEQVQQYLIDYNYKYNPKDKDFTLPLFNRYQDKRCMHVYVFDICSSAYIGELNPKDLFEF